MIDAKTAAKELVEKYMQIDIGAIGKHSWGMTIKEAKACAIIAVDEVISEYKKLEKQFNGDFKQLDWWKEIKAAIESM